MTGIADFTSYPLCFSLNNLRKKLQGAAICHNFSLNTIDKMIWVCLLGVSSVSDVYVIALKHILFHEFWRPPEFLISPHFYVNVHLCGWFLLSSSAIGFAQIRKKCHLRLLVIPTVLHIWCTRQKKSASHRHQLVHQVVQYNQQCPGNFTDVNCCCYHKQRLTTVLWRIAL